VGRKSPDSSEGEISEFSKQINLSFTSRISEHSGAFRIRLPRKDAEFYEISPGDVVHVIVDAVKGERRVKAQSQK
jgi:hypothetical protein